MRYAIDGTVKPSRASSYDVVIIGAGIAGLYTALNLEADLSCCIFAKETIDISNSWLAQGGIAAAVSPTDSVLHYRDTLTAGAGLCDESAVRVLVDEGPWDIKHLVEMHVPFDLNESGDLDRTREGGHHINRIVHAGGDATGRETVKTLAFIASQRKNIIFRDNTFFVDILEDAEGAVSGLVVKDHDGEYEVVSTKFLVIATGGCGQVYKTSTNPYVATGDGLAAAMRAGAALRNMEFIQFHPTGLWSPDKEQRAFLISESVRGEGGLLKNKEGVRFMLGKHELNELAPRDIVARAIFAEMKRTGDDHVYIDITSKSEEELSRRFPTIYNECLRRGINIAKDWIPVCPVQHYLMGGIQTDLNSRSTVPGLYACGEAASTGVHGANRLASNSMLECLVFGRRAACDISSLAKHGPEPQAVLPELPARPALGTDFKALRRHMQELMSSDCFVIRTKEGLTAALEEMTGILTGLENGFVSERDYAEDLNLAEISVEILRSALARSASVGAHYRED